MALNVCRKTQLRPFLELHQKQVFMFFVGGICLQKAHENVLGKFWEIRAKIILTPKLCLLLHLRL